jgi:hypothetical protein
MNLLERYIQQLVEDELSTNATKNKPYGNYLFGEPRQKPTRQRPEKDTEKEIQIYDMIHRWTELGDLTNTEFPRELIALRGILDKGLYKDVLEPSRGGVVYRGMQSSVSKIKKKFGENIFDNVTDKDPIVKINNVKYYPGNKWLSSWTYNPKVAVDFSAYAEFQHQKTMYSSKTVVYVVYKANVDSSNFILNYKEFKGSTYMQEEEELISLGPVNCEEVVLAPMGVLYNTNVTPIQLAKTLSGELKQ